MRNRCEDSAIRFFEARRELLEGPSDRVDAPQRGDSIELALNPAKPDSGYLSMVTGLFRSNEPWLTSNWTLGSVAEECVP